jgi:hypothetical protein
MMDMNEINILLPYGWFVVMKRKIGVYSWTFSFSFGLCYNLPFYILLLKTGMANPVSFFFF